MAVTITPADTDILGPGNTSNPVSMNLAGNNPASDRILVATIVSRFRSGKPTGVTIEGVTATEAVGGFLGSPANFSYSVWFAAVPSGTGIDIAATFPNTAGAEIAMSLFEMFGANATVVDTDQGNGLNVDNITLSSVTIPASGGAIWAAIHGEQTESTVWTNATGFQDANLGASRGASGYSTTAGTPSVLIDEGIVGATNFWAACGAAWGPASAPAGSILRQMMQQHH